MFSTVVFFRFVKTLNKILDQTKLKAFADGKLNVTKMIISVFDRVENIVGKGEIACTILGVIKVGIVWSRVNSFTTVENIVGKGENAGY